MNEITILEASFHRNGICGEGFHAIRFRWKPDDATKEETFIATLFDGEGRCAVLSLDRMETCGVGFARGNSWRGDHFEARLRKAVEDGEGQVGSRVGPFAVP